jgi:hypothetical protein
MHCTYKLVSNYTVLGGDDPYKLVKLDPKSEGQLGLEDKAGQI